MHALQLTSHSEKRERERGERGGEGGNHTKLCNVLPIACTQDSESTWRSGLERTVHMSTQPGSSKVVTT